MIVTSYYDPNTTTVNSDYVNVIIKPSSGLDIAFPRVKYYIYRGLKKDSLFTSGGAILPAASSNNELIADIWKAKTDQETISGPLPDPTPVVLGFDASLVDSDKIEEVFNGSKAPILAHSVKEGEWFADFTSASGVKIGFEVIMDTDMLTVDMGYVRKSSHREDVSSLIFTSPTTQQEYDLRMAREKVLSWVDPAAFFGMHYYVGVKVSTYSGSTKTTERKKKELVFTDLLDGHFATADRVYLDIRSEKGYSYNFYDNYKDGSGNNIQFEVNGSGGFTTQAFTTNDWPILYGSGSGWLGSKKTNRLELKLRVNDNTKPLLYFENPAIIRRRRSRKHFWSDSKLLDGSSVDWTKSIKLKFPNYGSGSNKKSVATCLQLQYFRQEDNTSSPGTVLKLQEEKLDDVFGSIDMPELDLSAPFDIMYHTKKGFTQQGGYSYVTDTGAFFNPSTVMMFAEKRHAYQENNSAILPRADLSNLGLSSISIGQFFPKNMAFGQWEIEETAGNFVKIVSLAAYNKPGGQPKVKDLFFLGLTQLELFELRSLTGFGTAHKKFLLFEKITGTVDLDGLPFYKYKLKVQGLDPAGNKIVAAPTTDIFVYGDGENVLASKDFADLANMTSLLPDPGRITEYEDAGFVIYDGTDSDVISLESTGVMTVTDDHGSGKLTSPQVKFQGYFAFPVDSSGALDWSGAPYPLLTIVHGNGHQYGTYDEIAKFLAKNGIAVQVIDCKISTQEFEMDTSTVTSGSLTFSHEFVSANGGTLFLYIHNATPANRKVYKVEAGLPVDTGWTHGTEFEVDASGSPYVFKFLRTANYEDQHGMAAIGRMNVLFRHLELARTKYTTAQISNNIAIMGHSRGGEAVVRAPEFIAGSAAPATLNNIEAVISLAPTDQYDQEDLEEDVPFFVLYGSQDGDIKGARGYRPNSTTVRSGSGGFTLYDRAIPSSGSSRKVMSFVHGASHNGFITTNSDNTSAPMTPDQQKSITRAYFNAFLRTHLKGETRWEPYLQGDLRPPSITGAGVHQQYKQMPNSSGLGKDWETGGGWSIVTAETTFSSGDIYEGALWPHDIHSPHETQGLILKWKSGDKITFEVDASGKNVSAFEVLSFRIGHRFKSSSKYDSVEKMHVGLTDSSNNRHTFQIPRNVPFPDSRSPKSLIKSAMITMRLPLSEFDSNGVNLNSITKMELIFPTEAGGSGRVVVDDLEFAN